MYTDEGNVCVCMCLEFSPILFRFSPSGDYYAPAHGEFQTYIDYIRTLPIIPHPEVFGLHENADITKDNQETQQVKEGMFLGIPLSHVLYEMVETFVSSTLLCNH